MSLERTPDLGRKPVALHVKLPPLKNQDEDHLGPGLRELYRRGEFCDIHLVCAERRFAAHRVVLAAQSDVFKEGLAAAGSPAFGSDAKQEIRLAEVANPEAVKYMLDYIYQMNADGWEDYQPRTQAINRDVLRLAENFRLPGLRDRAVHCVAKDVTTGNVVERLTICEEYGLDSLRSLILGQLTANKKALAEVANSPQIMEYPRLMQALLQHASTGSDTAAEESASPTSARRSVTTRVSPKETPRKKLKKQ